MTMVALLVIEILRTLTWTGQHAVAGQQVFRTATELEQAWTADGGDKAALPKVDFEKEMVLAVFAGEKRTGGHRIQLEKVLLKQSQTKPKYYVLYRETAPPADAMVTMALTYPSHVVVVPKVTSEVMFFAADSPQGQELMRRL